MKAPFAAIALLCGTAAQAQDVTAITCMNFSSRTYVAEAPGGIPTGWRPTPKQGNKFVLRLDLRNGNWAVTNENREIGVPTSPSNCATEVRGATMSNFSIIRRCDETLDTYVFYTVRNQLRILTSSVTTMPEVHVRTASASEGECRFGK